MPRRSKQEIVSKKDVGQRLRSLRLAQNMSQVTLAKVLGVTQSNVSGLERGVRSLTIHQVAKLAKALDVSTDELLLGIAPNGRNGDSLVQDRRFLRRLRQIDTLTKRQRDALLLTVDSFLKASHPR